jgi:DMSO/TMAO reductase YedYZ molybdopterin-dependent catalytic subunit
LHIQHEGRGAERPLRLQTMQRLPRVDLVTELKCVEGWSQVMHFGGVRFLDFMTRLGLGTRSGRAPHPVGRPHDLYRYVYLATPDQAYYVGLDMASALHPQTLLCDAMNGQPLSRGHGAPLRLYLAVKYGYKSLKRVGLIRFQDERPPDYWGDQGYDWYAGL